MPLEKAIRRCIDRCNLIGENVEIYSIMYQYKAIRELPDEEFEAVYDEIAGALGFLAETSLMKKESRQMARILGKALLPRRS
ncbi:MAG: hypothetical protein K6F23_16005 [Solobacterium sp.]|nr:hypothetical protein [Solobacterium sp.]